MASTNGRGRRGSSPSRPPQVGGPGWYVDHVVQHHTFFFFFSSFFSFFSFFSPLDVVDLHRDGLALGLVIRPYGSSPFSGAAVVVVASV